MSIQITDGFRLNVGTPVDDRMVTSGTSSRNNIAYKYEGLRVFDIAQKTAFVFFDGQWTQESETSVSAVIPGLTGTENKILKFKAGNKIGESSIYDDGTFVGIGTTTPTTAYKLQVSGNIGAVGFVGNGTYLEELNASKITNGTLAIARIQSGSTGQILSSGAAGPSWINTADITSGKITVTNDTANTANQYINFTSAFSGPDGIKASSTGLIFNPSKAQILIKEGTETNPAYSFISNFDTGIYRLSGEKSIGFSTGGVNRMTIKSNGYVGIGTTTPGSSLHILGQVLDANVANNNNVGQIFISDPDSTWGGLSLGYAYYAGQYEYARIQTKGNPAGPPSENFTLYLQEKSGRVKIGPKPTDISYYDGQMLDVYGSTDVRGVLYVGTKQVGDAAIKVGYNRTSNGNTFIDLVGQTAVTSPGTRELDYGLRLIRWGTGNLGDPRGISQIVHTGTQRFDIVAEQAANIHFWINNSERMRISSNGYVGIGTVPTAMLDVNGDTKLRGSVFIGDIGNTARIELGSGRSSDGNAYIDFTSAQATTDYDFRIIRAAGQNGLTRLDHRGTESLEIVSANSRILFYANGAERMRIGANGNVGIGTGTDTPSTKLHVVGQVLDASAANNNNVGQIFISDPDSDWGGLSLGYVYYTGQYEYARIQTKGNPAGSNFENFTLYLQEKSGRVKIGPKPTDISYYDGQMLDVYGSADVRGVLYVGTKQVGDATIKVGPNRLANGNSFIDFIGDSSGSYTDHGLRIVRYGAGADNGISQIVHRGTARFDIVAAEAAPIVFWTTLSERMRILPTGNVGIGTDSPLYKLEVNGETALRDAVFVGRADGDAQIKIGKYRSTNGSSYIDLVSETTGYTDHGLRLIRWGNTTDLGISQIVHRGTARFDIVAAEAAPIVFYTTLSERMRILPTGNVGIGTNTPSALLDVNGDTKLRGSVFIGDIGNTARIELGSGRSSDGNAYVDFTSAAATSDYDFRIIRAAGQNGLTQLDHRGTGNFEIAAVSSAIYLSAPTEVRINIDGTTDRVKFYSEGIDINANGAGLKLKATTQGANTYIEFFGKGGASTTNLTDRSAYVGFESSGNNNFTIYNVKTSHFVSIQSDGTRMSGDVTVGSNINLNNGARIIKINNTAAYSMITSNAPKFYIGDSTVSERNNPIWFNRPINATCKMDDGTGTKFNDNKIHLLTNNNQFNFDYKGDNSGDVYFNYNNGSSGIRDNEVIRFYRGRDTAGDYSRLAALAFTVMSDVRLKENIKELQPVIEDISKLKVVEYNFIQNSEINNIGLIAQEVKEIFPSLVYISKGDKDELEDMHSIDYSKFSPILIKGLQEVIAENVELKARLAAIEAKLGL